MSVCFNFIVRNKPHDKIKRLNSVRLLCRGVYLKSGIEQLLNIHFCEGSHLS